MRDESIVGVEKKQPSRFLWLYSKQNLSQGYRRGHTLMANDRYPRGNDNLSRISARTYSCAEINLITWLPQRDEIFILPAGEAPPPRNETTTAPIDSAIYQLILSTRPRRCNEFPL